MKAVIVGAGKMGLVHASILNTFPNVQLVGIYDKSRLIRKFMANALGKKKIFNSLESMLNSDFDTVYITTPIPSHYSIIKEIYNCKENVNVFAEKTLAHDYNDSVKLCELAQNSKGKNMVGYMKKFSVTFGKANELIKQEAIGSILSFEAHAYSSDFFGVNTANKRLNRGGVLCDLGSHVIDLSLWLLGAFEVNKNEREFTLGLNDIVSFKVSGNDHLEGVFNISWSKEGYHVPEFGLSLIGSKGRITVDDDAVLLETAHDHKRWYRHDLNDNIGFLLGAPEYYREDSFFVEHSTQSLASVDFLSAAKTDYIINRATEGI
jgi:predicted dehydrogenase